MFDYLTNQKKTKNELSEKHEFVGFALNEQKKESKKIFQEILKTYPQMYKFIEEFESIKNENEEFLNENIKLGEELERLKLELKNNDINILKKENNVLRQKLYNLELESNEVKNIALKNIESFKILEKEYERGKRENKELKEKRGIFSIAKDKLSISFYENENKELRSKLERIGRVPISSMQIKKIIELHNEGLRYRKIALRVQVSKSTVSKYIQLYLGGKLDQI